MTVMKFESESPPLTWQEAGMHKKKQDARSRRGVSDFFCSNREFKEQLGCPKRRQQRRNYQGKLCVVNLLMVLTLIVNILVSAQAAKTSQDTKVATEYSQCSALHQRYRPEGALGIRYKKQILQGRDMRAELHESHMLESAIRKKHFLAMFGLENFSLMEDDFQLQQLCPSPFSHQQAANQEIEELFCLSAQPMDELGQDPLYMSSLFYKPRYMHVSQVNSKNNEGAALGGITIQQQGSEQRTDLPRDNSYLNLALNVRSTYELPIAVLDAMDQEQTIEGFLFKKAKHNNVDNFDIMRFIPETQPKLASLEMFQRNSFTYEDPDFISGLTNGMRPNQIQKLKPQSSVYRFFTQEVEFNPQKVTFNECQQLIPKFEILKITNKQRNKVLEIKTMIASTPEITFYPPENKKGFPLRIRPQESVEIKVALIAETLGLFEGVIHVLIDDWVYVSTLNGYVIPNEYEIAPFHVTDVLVNDTFVMPLYITNPSATDTMIVEEMYSTDPLLQLRWPNSSSIISQSLEAMEDQVVKYILIPEGSRKHLSDIVFEINRTMDFFFELHLRTSLHDVIRVPIYYHVHSDILKLTPTVVDFGLAPLNFDVLKIPIYARSKVSELLAIQEILLPLGDPRLDFQMVDAILRAPSTSNMVRKGRELFLGYVLLNPTKVGIIESVIKLTLLGQRSNKTFHLEIPIVGLVHTEANVFGTTFVQHQDESRLNYPTPLVQFDVSDYLITKQTKRKVSEQPQFRQVILQTPLMLKNTFKVPIKLRGIVNNNPELRIMIENQQGNHYNQGIVLQPGETLKYAQVELQTQALKITQGNKYISVIVNNTLIPVAIGIYDRGLICAWEEHENVISLEDIPLCSNGYELNFDYVAVNDIKVKKLKITNVNPVNMTIEQVAKQQLDDLHIFIERVVDKNGNHIMVQNPEGDSMQSILGPKRTKRLINFVLQPYQTMLIVFQIIAKESKQKFSRIDFQMKEGSSKDFSFNYKYHVISGSLTLVPQVIKFNPTFPGLPQQKSLVIRSTFDVPITVKTITSTDMRIMPILHNVVIKPNNKTEFGALSFDPSKTTSFAFQSNSQLNLNNIDIASMLTHQLGHIDPATRQNIMNLVQGFTNNVGAKQAGEQPPQIAMIHLPKGVGQQHLPHNYQMQALFTPQDIENYREKQKVWEAQGFREGKAGEITTFVTIETNVLTNITIPIRAQVRRPSLTDHIATQEESPTAEQLIVEPIDFDVVQVGTAQARNIKVINPTDDPMTFALFITTPQNFEKIYKPLAKGQKSKPAQPFDKDFHFQNFCGPKLFKLEKQDGYKQVNLDNNNDPVAVCLRVQAILQSLQNNTAVNEDINHLRKKLEDYFKDLQIAQIQREFAAQQLNEQKLKLGASGTGSTRSSLVDAVSGSQYSHSVGAGNQQDYDVIFYDKDLENITNTINQHSHARPLDQQTLKILKDNYEKQKYLFAELSSQQGGLSSLYNLMPDFYSVLQGTFSILKTILLARNSPPGTKFTANSTAHMKPEKPKKKEFKLPPNHYKLSNQVLNDIIVNNDTTRLYKDIIRLTDPFISTYTGQSFFINPKCQGQVYRVEARSNFTVRDAIIFQPQSLFQTQMEMKLILKNNLTFIHALDLKGKSGTGFLEVVKILKKAPPISGLSSDHYINALTLSGQIYGQSSSSFSTHHQQNDFNHSNRGAKVVNGMQENITARILYNVYGIGREESPAKDSHLHHREMLMRANYRYGGSAGNAAATAAALMINSEMSDPNALPFHIGQEDIVVPIKDQGDDEFNSTESSSEPQKGEETEYEEENEYVIINRILERASQSGAFLDSEIYQKGSVKVQTYHKRALVVQNTGNLPLSVDTLSLEDQGCYSQNFIIENCHPFTLQPGEQHWIHVGYKTDYTLAKIKKRLILKTKQEVIQEYTIEVNMPVEHMRIANELLPLSQFEEWQLYILKFSLLAVTFTIFVFVAIDVFSHYKFANQLVPDHEEKILALEDAQLIQSQTSQLQNISSSQQRTGTKRLEGLPPILKNQINHDQVYSLYQQAQDKLNDRAAGSAGKHGQNQLVLLKEVGNICSNRRTLICLEAQKQAIEADKEQRRATQLRNQFYAQQARQEKERQIQIEQESARQRAPPIVQENIPKKQINVPLKQEAVSVPSDTSMNDSSSNLNNQTHEQISNEDLKAAQDSQKGPKVPKIPKKLKRDLEKKIKEQQEAEERFRLLQIEKQKREALELQQAEYRRQQEEVKRQERLKQQEQHQRELEMQRQQRERQQREREEAEAEARRMAAQNVPKKIPSSNHVIEDQDKEKPEEYKGGLEEAKDTTSASQVTPQIEENKKPSILTQRSTTDDHIKVDVPTQQTSQYRVVNRQYESFKKSQPSQKYNESNSQTSLSVQTAQSLTQNEIVRQMIGQGGQKESSFVNTGLRQEQPSVHEEAFAEDEEDSFFQENKPRCITVAMSKKKAESERKESSSSAEEKKDSDTPQFERKQFGEEEDKIQPTQFDEVESQDIRIRSPSPRIRLSKEDLKPFFDSQRTQEEKKNEQLKQTIVNSNNASPLLGSANAPFGVTSIFSFNPLNIFAGSAGGTSSQAQTPDTNALKQRPSQGPSQVSSNPVVDFSNLNEPTDFNQEEDDQEQDSEPELQEDEEEDDDQEEEDQKPNDLYSLFRTASSLLARPNFVNQTSKQSKFLPPQAKKSTKSKTQKASLSFLPPQKPIIKEEKNALPESSKYTSSIFSMEEDEDSKDDQKVENQHQATSSLFRGSLFGESGMFNNTSSQYKTQTQTKPVFSSYGNNMNPWSTQPVNLDQSFSSHDPYSVQSLLTSSQGPMTQQQSAALRRNQQIYHENYPAPPYPAGMPPPASGIPPPMQYPQGYAYPPPPPPGLGYRPVTQTQSLYAQYNSGINYPGGTVGRMSNMEPKTGGSFGAGTGSMLYGPNQSFSGPNYPPPGFQQPNPPLYKNQPSAQYQYAQPAPWSGLGAAPHNPAGPSLMGGPPPGFSQALYTSGKSGPIASPHQPLYSSQQRSSSSFQQQNLENTAKSQAVESEDIPGEKEPVKKQTSFDSQ